MEIISDNVKNNKEKQINRITAEDWAKNFARQLKETMEADYYNSLMKSAGNIKYQPILAEQYLQDFNYNPCTATQAEIQRWLLNPAAFDNELRALSQYLEKSVQQYGRVVKHSSDTKAWYSEIVSVDNKPTQNTWIKAGNYLKKYNYDYNFPNIDWELSQSGIVAKWIIEDDKGITFIPLPTDYIYITGVWQYGYVGCVDLTFFDRIVYQKNSVPELYKAYETFVAMREIQKVQGDDTVDLISYQYYPLPIDKSWIWVFDTRNPSKIPPLTGALSSALKINSYRDVLQQRTLLDTWKLLALEIPRDQDDNLIMDTQEANDVVKMIFNTLPDGFDGYATPFKTEAIVANQVSQANILVDIGEKLFYRSVGATANLFGSPDNKNASGMKLNLKSDYYFFEHTYKQFENMVNLRYRLKYGTGSAKNQKYQFRFWGDRYSKSDDIKEQQSMVAGSNMPVFKLMALNGYKPYDIVGQVELENILGLKDKMKPMVTSYTSSGTNEGGRESKSDDELSDNGNLQRDLGSNDNRSKEDSA